MTKEENAEREVIGLAIVWHLQKGESGKRIGEEQLHKAVERLLKARETK